MCSFLFHLCYWTRASCDLFFNLSIDKGDFVHFEDTMPPAMQDSQTGIILLIMLRFKVKMNLNSGSI